MAKQETKREQDDTDLAEDALDDAQRAVEKVAAEARSGVDTFDLPDFASHGTGFQHAGIELLSDVNLHVKVELGRTRMYVEDVLRINPGSVVELDKPAGDPVDIFVNDRLIARGEVIVVNDSFCVRVSEIVKKVEHDE